MKKLEKTLHKNGFKYKQIIRNKQFAIYQQIIKGHCGIEYSYEVFKINIMSAGTKIGINKYEEDTELMPGNENFGKSAWNIRDKKEAIKKYNYLISNNS